MPVDATLLTTKLPNQLRDDLHPRLPPPPVPNLPRIEALARKNPPKCHSSTKHPTTILISSLSTWWDGPTRALDYLLRDAKSFERCAVDGEPSLDLVMSLHVLAAIYCSLRKSDGAIPEREIKVPEVSRGADHALVAFSGYMQLGDTDSMLGQLDWSIDCYKK